MPPSTEVPPYPLQSIRSGTLERGIFGLPPLSSFFVFSTAPPNAVGNIALTGFSRKDAHRTFFSLRDARLPLILPVPLPPFSALSQMSLLASPFSLSRSPCPGALLLMHPQLWRTCRTSSPGTFPRNSSFSASLGSSSFAFRLYEKHSRSQPWQSPLSCLLLVVVTPRGGEDWTLEQKLRSFRTMAPKRRCFEGSLLSKERRLSFRSSCTEGTGG